MCERKLTEEELRELAKEIDIKRLYCDVLRVALSDLRTSINDRNTRASKRLLDFFFYHEAFDVLDYEPLYILANFLLHNFILKKEAVDKRKEEFYLGFLLGCIKSYEFPFVQPNVNPETIIEDFKFFYEEAKKNSFRR